MNKIIFVILGIVILSGVGIILWRSFQTGDANAGQNAAQPTVTSPTTSVAPTSTAVIITPIMTITATPTPSVSPTVSTTQVITDSSTFEQNLNTSWVSGLSSQTIVNDVYFISGTSNNLIKKGSSSTDSNAATIYTAESDHKVGSFNVLGTSIIIALTRNTQNQSKLIRFYPSSSQKTNLYTYESSKVEISQFLIPKTVGTEYYLGLTGINNLYQPMVIFSKQYTQNWVRTISDAAKTDKITALGIAQDGKTLKIKLDSAGTVKVITLSIPANE